MVSLAQAQAYHGASTWKEDLLTAVNVQWRNVGSILVSCEDHVPSRFSRTVKPFLKYFMGCCFMCSCFSAGLAHSSYIRGGIHSSTQWCGGQFLRQHSIAGSWKSDFLGMYFLYPWIIIMFFSQTGLCSSDIPCKASRIPIIHRRENPLRNICFINSFENMTGFKMSSTKICDICNSFKSWPFKGSWDKGFISNLCICDSYWP